MEEQMVEVINAIISGLNVLSGNLELLRQWGLTAIIVFAVLQILSFAGLIVLHNRTKKCHAKVKKDKK